MNKLFCPELGLFPFSIHGSPACYKDPHYPTHTHGLSDIGLPEFIFDPLAFGAEGNALRINAAFRFFMNPENDTLFQEILTGKVVKLPAVDLDARLEGEPFTYCFREVTAEFEAVKQAYGSAIASWRYGMRFIQIWVDGDDLSLQNLYYEGGVTR